MCVRVNFLAYSINTILHIIQKSIISVTGILCVYAHGWILNPLLQYLLGGYIRDTKSNNVSLYNILSGNTVQEYKNWILDS